MNFDQNQVQQLAEKFFNGSATEEEQRLLHQWYDTVNMTETGIVLTDKPQTNDGFGQEILAELKQMIAAERQPAIVRPLLWRRLAAAASIILMLGVGSYFLFINKGGEQNEIVVTTVMPQDVKAPETNRAMITLADGSIVSLDSVQNGMLATQGNVKLMKTVDGKIVYNALQQAPGNTEVVYNTLTNPRGSKVINMTLADGSSVWLNAGSSLTYPITFEGNERRVEITGEAYFEIAKNAAMPFIVKRNDVEVQVLGTHFNVNAYDDEADLKITLLEGVVKVKNENASQVLAPGQQVRLKQDGPIALNKNVNVEEVMAWKNGNFLFERTDIQTVMRQISRWYDVEVEYHGNVSQHFGGTVSRYVNMSRVFEMLELTGGVKFKIDGKKVIVMP